MSEPGLLGQGSAGVARRLRAPDARGRGVRAPGARRAVLDGQARPSTGRDHSEPLADDTSRQPPGTTAGPPEGLLIDWGGVMTSSLFASFTSFCTAKGLDPQALASAFRGDEATREILFGFEEGRIAEADFERHLGDLLGAESAEGLIDNLFAGARLEQSMVAAVSSARAASVKTGLISNSWGTGRYPRDLLAELFDGVVISGEVGIRKPTLRIYELGAEAIGVPPQRCVFVDDLPFNLPPAQQLGMAVIHHTDPARTIEQLERLLGIPSLA